ncbi:MULTISPECIES: hypothetical protein [unclassified Streptomyces]|uniref:hypothetical protein n=1 Tax=unclassified Streptomyces TaxID=2593676 RepID=UPI001F3411A9|nr:MULTISPECIES: hypothetical protein [unclassified Streptomyces]
MIKLPEADGSLTTYEPDHTAPKEGVPDAARLAHGYHRLTGGNPLLLHRRR